MASDASKNPFKGEDIKVGQLAFYAQDEYLVSEKFTLTYGLRVDIPMYMNDMVDNPFSRSLNLLDADGKPETKLIKVNFQRQLHFSRHVLDLIGM